MTAGRVLHICHNCADADRSAALLVDALGLREVMRTDGLPSSGELFGMPGEITSMVAFLYDHRGPRVGPALEVEGWDVPPVAGAAFAEPHHVGMQAVGLRVPDPAAAVARLVAAGGEPVDHLPGFTSVRTPDGHVFDLLTSDDATTQMVHLRITCTDLAASTEWYGRIGFDRTGAPDVTTAAHTSRRLRLPEEPLELWLTQWHNPASFGRHYPVANHAGFYRMALRVDDTFAMYEELLAEGWAFDGPPLAIPMGGTSVPDLLVVFTRDPDGVAVEFVQRPLANFRN